MDLPRALRTPPRLTPEAALAVLGCSPAPVLVLLSLFHSSRSRPQGLTLAVEFLHPLPEKVTGQLCLLPPPPARQSSCYGLKACVPPPHTYVEVLTSVGVMWKWDLWEVIRIRGGHESCHDGFGPCKKRQEV